MTTEDTTSPAAVHSTAQLCVGDKVRMLVDIWDDGADHHPPGWLARKGEILLVKAISGYGGVAVAHEGNPGAFHVHMAEFETYNAMYRDKTCSITSET